MKWITSTTIKQWADTRSAQGLLPELILRLIRATSTNTSNIRFPNGDAVHLTGWDGVVESADAIFNIYNPQIKISAESETKRSIFREKDKTKRSKKESAQHSKSRNKSFVMTSVSAL